MSRRRRDSKLTVATLPLLRDDLVRHNDEVRRGVFDDDMTAFLAEHPGYEPEVMDLTKAELWWVTPSMCELVYAAAPSLPEGLTLGEVMPSLSGVLVWERGLGKTAIGMEKRRDGSMGTTRQEIVGVAWGISARYGFSINILARDDAAPLHVSTLSPHPDHPDDDGTRAATQALVTTWMLASQPTVGRTFQHEGQLRRSGLRKADLPMSVTVAALREIARPDDPGEGVHPEGASGRHVSVRFLVRGHWRQQACGPQRRMRKPVWVSPFVKGPEGAPFRETDLVKVWRR